MPLFHRDRGAARRSRPGDPPGLPAPGGRRPRPFRGRSILATTALVAGCLTGAVATGLIVAAPAQADAVPPAPAGWTTVFGEIGRAHV